jgi:hypothetical protein
MLIVRCGDSILQYPSRFADLSTRAMSPKPDLMVGCYINGKSVDLALSHNTFARFHVQTLVDAGFAPEDMDDISCGLIASNVFAFPTVLIERKSDNGSLYVAQNQVLGGLTCILEAIDTTTRRLGNELDIPAIGLVNYGNLVELP